MANVNENARMYLDRIADQAAALKNKLRSQEARLNRGRLNQLMENLLELYTLLGEQRAS
jgi:hypothetical protein